MMIPWNFLVVLVTTVSVLVSGGLAVESDLVETPNVGKRQAGNHEVPPKLPETVPLDHLLQRGTNSLDSLAYSILMGHLRRPPPKMSVDGKPHVTGYLVMDTHMNRSPQGRQVESVGSANTLSIALLPQDMEPPAVSAVSEYGVSPAGDSDSASSNLSSEMEPPSASAQFQYGISQEFQRTPSTAAPTAPPTTISTTTTTTAKPTNSPTPGPLTTRLPTPPQAFPQFLFVQQPSPVQQTLSTQRPTPQAQFPVAFPFRGPADGNLFQTGTPISPSHFPNPSPSPLPLEEIIRQLSMGSRTPENHIPAQNPQKLVQQQSPVFQPSMVEVFRRPIGPVRPFPTRSAPLQQFSTIRVTPTPKVMTKEVSHLDEMYPPEFKKALEQLSKGSIRYSVGRQQQQQQHSNLRTSQPPSPTSLLYPTILSTHRPRPAFPNPTIPSRRPQVHFVNSNVPTPSYSTVKFELPPHPNSIRVHEKPYSHASNLKPSIADKNNRLSGSIRNALFSTPSVLKALSFHPSEFPHPNVPRYSTVNPDSVRPPTTLIPRRYPTRRSTTSTTLPKTFTKENSEGIDYEFFKAIIKDF